MPNGSCAVVFAILLIIGSAGCLSNQSPQPTPQPTSLITALPTRESPVSTIKPADMALQLSDVPADYMLKERSDRIYPEMSQLSRDLGWRQGYSVTFYRLNLEKFGMTGLRQSIDLYPLGNMNKVFDIAKDAMISRANGAVTVYEMPLYRIGDKSIAYKTENTSIPYSLPVYTILFIKKDVFEELEMGGTTTDYETLKAVAGIAADKIP